MLALRWTNWALVSHRRSLPSSLFVCFLCLFLSSCVCFSQGIRWGFGQFGSAEERDGRLGCEAGGPPGQGNNAESRMTLGLAPLRQALLNIFRQPTTTIQVYVLDYCETRKE